MLRTIQIIALLQGIFLLFILLKNRSSYKKTTFWLFFGSIVSVLLFLIGDDENNLFVEGVDLFLFDSSLFITFFFLFFRYLKSGKETFEKKDFFFFLPNLIYLIAEISEINIEEENFVVEIIELLVEATFLTYLCYIIFYPIVNKAKSWVFYFAIPMALLLGLSYFNDILGLIGVKEFKLFSVDDFSSYLLLVIALLFYFITFNLINNPKSVIPKSKIQGYKKSNLNPDLIENCKQALLKAMIEDKLYLDSKLSIHELSKKIEMPRQYVSEVLNVHMNMGFQGFVNGYRIEEFINRLKDPKYGHYTLFGIASEVGFNSKTTFNSAFKKAKALTPQQYKNSLSQNYESGTE